MSDTKPDRPATRLFVQKAFESYNAGVLDVVKGLQRRIAVLEAKPHVKFSGTWERGKTYEPGEAVVRDGGLWICKATTPGEPSKDFVGWQLAVRKGSV